MVFPFLHRVCAEGGSDQIKAFKAVGISQEELQSGTLTLDDTLGRIADTFAPIGPCIVTADEVRDPHRLQIRLWVNGELKQNFNTSDMAHKIPRCVEWVTSIHTLEPGDVLATGTNHRGLSGFQNGDRIELETEGLGRLRVDVRDDLERTWSRETRLDRQQKGLEPPTTPQLTGKYTPAPK